MNYLVNGNHIFLIILVTFLFSVALVPLIKKMAYHVGALDYPNERKVHKKPIARLGGLSIFLSFLLGYMLFAKNTPEMISILIGGFLIILLGVFDDIKEIKARYKLIMQIIAASIVVFYGNITLDYISAFGISITFGNFGPLFSIFFIISIINAINLIDGLDGLAAGISSIYFLTISVLAFIINRISGLDIILTLIMLGSTLGFLVYNFNPASIFMGDTGSMFLGYMIAVTALIGYKGATLTSFIIPLIILFVPFVDTFFAILRRLINGKKISTPDKEHVHHQLLKLNKSTTKTVLIIYLINIIASAISIFYYLGIRKISVLLYSILLIVLMILIFKTDILFEGKKK